MPLLVDSHCHIDFKDFSGKLPETLSAMRAAGIGHALCANVTMEHFPRVLKLAETHDHIYASVGVHPNHVSQAGTEPDAAQLAALAAHPRVVAIGETGLDYYRHKAAEVDWQRARFRTHIRAAKHAGKPLIIHTREAAPDTLSILCEENAQEAGGVFHCFSEDWAVAQAAMDLGFYISFSGVVTYKNAQNVQEVAKRMPLERMLVETDSPYLAPTPFRGKTNQPAYVKYVAEHVASLRGITLDQLAEATTANFFTLFKDAQPS